MNPTMVSIITKDKGCMNALCWTYKSIILVTKNKHVIAGITDAQRQTKAYVSLNRYSRTYFAYIFVMHIHTHLHIRSNAGDKHVPLKSGHIHQHDNDVIMSTMASQITSLTIVYSIVYLSAGQRKHQSSASLAFVRGIHRRPVNSPHKRPVTLKMFPFDDVIMQIAVS